MSIKPALIYVILIATYAIPSHGQDSLEFNGELMGFINYAPDNRLDLLFGGRYLPELNYAISFKNETQLDLDAAANIYGNIMLHPFDSSYSDGGIKPYRIWIRYTGKQFELRLGLQKINFGSAKFIRPLQWFDDIDPRDPLQFSNGVYAFLGRYYFLNNANIWLWFLYGNENPRGYELLKSNPGIPEFGGRIQLPIPKGELAFSYHHRTADSANLPEVMPYNNIPEDIFGLDGKWDISIGLWFEASYVHKGKDLGILTNQTMIDLGTDYTFGIGNGLNLGFEHLIWTLDGIPFGFTNIYNISSAIFTYPVGFFDNINCYLSYLWEGNDISFLVNYGHDFNKFTGYFMAYYTPEMQQNIFKYRYAQSFSGPGIRLMAVFNH